MLCVKCWQLGHGGYGCCGGRGSSSSGIRCVGCNLDAADYEVMGHIWVVKQLPRGCPSCRYIRNDLGQFQFEPVMENDELILRPATQSLTAPTPDQTLAVSPYAARSVATQSQSSPTSPPR